MQEIYEFIDWSPPPRELRRFGWAVGGALTVVGLVICWRLGRVAPALKVLWSVAAAFALLGTVLPRILFWPYRVWMGITVPVAVLIQTVLLCVFFYGMLTPVGLVMRLFGRDPLNRRLSASAESCWTPCKPPQDRRRYFRQY